MFILKLGPALDAVLSLLDVADGDIWGLVKILQDNQLISDNNLNLLNALINNGQEKLMKNLIDKAGEFRYI